VNTVRTPGEQRANTANHRERPGFWRAPGVPYIIPGSISPAGLILPVSSLSMRTSIVRPFAAACALAACIAAAPAHAQPADATGLSGVWTGTYLCFQGPTALELVLHGNAHGIVRGSFSFGGTPDRPEVPGGSYRVLGRLTGTSLVLRPIDEAIELPEGYIPVGIQATVTGPRRMAGLIEGPGCGAITAERTDGFVPAEPPPGGYGPPRWEVVAEMPSGRIHLDVRTRLPYGAATERIWARFEALEDIPDARLRDGEARELELEFDCDASLVRTWHTLDFAADGQLREVDASLPYGWTEVREDSVYMAAYDHACFGALLPSTQG
jgi:hypothetical protein